MILNCMNRKYRKRPFLNFWQWCFNFFRRNFCIFSVNPPPPPPHSRRSKFNSSPPPCRSELVSDWLKFTRAWVKTLRGYLFRISIMVWVGGINRKDPNFNYSEEFGTQKIGDGYHKFRLNRSEGFNKIFGVGILENLLAAKSEKVKEIALSSWYLIF